MVSNVEPEEAQAILDLMDPGAGAAPQVTERDFRHPRRLGIAMLDELRRRTLAGVPEIQARLAEILCATHSLELGSLSEISADGLFDDLTPPFAVLRFEVAGQPAWIVWETEAAVAAVEKILGSAAEGEVRRLSHVEAKVLAELLGCVAAGVAEALGVEVAGRKVVQGHEDVGSWRDAGEGADPHRLSIELSFAGPGSESTLVVHLPGFGTDSQSTETDLEAPAELPAHLVDVEVEVSARIEGCEVPLDQLLSLEEGDVIPLEARVGDPTLVAVEGKTFAHGRLGTHRGQLAVRIEHMERDEERLG